MTDLSSLVTELSAIPTISSGNFTDNSGENFDLNLNVRKYCGDVSKKTNYLWRSDGPLIETTSEIKFRSLSPDSQTLLVGKSSGEKDRVIEIWKEGGKNFSSIINVSSIHGDFCTDEVFGSFTWSPNGESFSYVSERKSAGKEGENNDFKKFAEVENFGERLQTINEPVLCLFNLKSLKVETIEIKYSDVDSTFKRYPAQPAFLNNDSLVFMGIDVGSKKLGMTFIFCRPTSIYRLNLEDRQAIRISDNKYSSRSPIVSKDGEYVVYLRNSLGRSHFKASQLVAHNLESNSDSILVDIVIDPKTEFPGIFCQRLPAQRFTDKIYLNTCWFEYRSIVEVNVNDKSISRIMPEFEGSSRILNIRNGFILFCNSTPKNPGSVFIHNSSSGANKFIDVSAITCNPAVQDIDKRLEHSVIELNSKVHIVLLKPKSSSGKTPLIIIPHGGPNSVYSVDYVLYPVIFAKMGIAVASINYTGSIGFGDSSIEALEGQIGVRDVEDCYLALQLLLKSNQFDESKVVVMGGSHGGYLTAHLSAKYPDIFRGAILRNPVIDLPSMTVTSDIADWTFGQLGIEVDQLKSRAISEEEMKLFLQRSPSTYAKNVKCPTLVMLGSLDLRVPPSQGRYWANLLKGNGVDCQVFVFPDANHGLETAESERFGLETILSFFQKIEL